MVFRTNEIRRSPLRQDLRRPLAKLGIFDPLSSVRTDATVSESRASASLVYCTRWHDEASHCGGSAEREEGGRDDNGEAGRELDELDKKREPAALISLHMRENSTELGLIS